jgi:hypothetical protein
MVRMVLVVIGIVTFGSRHYSTINWITRFANFLEPPKYLPPKGKQTTWIWFRNFGVLASLVEFLSRKSKSPGTFLNTFRKMGSRDFRCGKWTRLYPLVHIPQLKLNFESVYVVEQVCNECIFAKQFFVKSIQVAFRIQENSSRSLISPLSFSFYLFFVFILHNLISLNKKPLQTCLLLNYLVTL